MTPRPTLATSNPINMPIYETVFKQVLVPSEKYLYHLCANRLSIIDALFVCARLSRHFGRTEKPKCFFVPSARRAARIVRHSAASGLADLETLPPSTPSLTPFIIPFLPLLVHSNLHNQSTPSQSLFDHNWREKGLTVKSGCLLCLMSKLTIQLARSTPSNFDRHPPTSIDSSLFSDCCPHSRSFHTLPVTRKQTSQKIDGRGGFERMDENTC
ncbi:hypothetical protein BLNAU_1570 [Blattamonas nauphoetae]|uniref:Uncharacterized protein n=1 Tax=Blattamonas nauphoetae TaxID=2049346 RepID=A0ABQ9YIE2_9EUKA|nr:hypothetical protein BLNAU_1570 [Blattamonas nauphoetae]